MQKLMKVTRIKFKVFLRLVMPLLFVVVVEANRNQHGLMNERICVIYHCVMKLHLYHIF